MSGLLEKVDIITQDLMEVERKKIDKEEANLNKSM